MFLTPWEQGNPPRPLRKTGFKISDFGIVCTAVPPNVQRYAHDIGSPLRKVAPHGTPKCRVLHRDNVKVYEMYKALRLKKKVYEMFKALRLLKKCIYIIIAPIEAAALKHIHIGTHIRVYFTMFSTCTGREMCVLR